MQRFIQGQQTIVDANGNAVFTFQPPPQGYANTGTLTITDSPDNVKWTVAVAGQTLTTILGTTATPNIQSFGNEVITVTATGLTTGGIYHATWSGSTDTSERTPVVAPIAGAANTISSGAARLALAQTNVTINANLSLGGAMTQFPVVMLPNERSIILMLTQPNGQTGLTFGLVVQGNQTGCLYYVGNITNEQIGFSSFGSQWGWPPITVPAYGVRDSTVTVSFFYHGNANLSLPIFTVLAMPDEVITGSPGNPTDITGTVTLAGNQSNAPYFVELSDGSNPVGRVANPLYCAAPVTTGAQTVFVNTATAGTSGTLVAGPAAGTVRYVDTLSLYATAAGTAAVSFSTAGVPAAIGQGLTLGQPGVTAAVPPTIATKIPLLNGQSLFYLQPSATALITAIYHDEAL